MKHTIRELIRVYNQRDDAGLDRVITYLNEKYGFDCGARKNKLPDGIDCGWPSCGCDPYADKVLEAINHPIGEFSIGQFYLSRPTYGGVQIRRCNGEGGNFNEQLLEKSIADFYERNF